MLVLPWLTCVNNFETFSGSLTLLLLLPYIIIFWLGIADQRWLLGGTIHILDLDVGSLEWT